MENAIYENAVANDGRQSDGNPDQDEQQGVDTGGSLPDIHLADDDVGKQTEGQPQ
ncbi:MAG TPA: hypothetical protein PK580_06680 [Nitrosomonas halophila]|nr:hypothetical protein [Nitrosomonas halophila]